MSHVAASSESKTFLLALPRRIRARAQTWVNTRGIWHARQTRDGQSCDNEYKELGCHVVKREFTLEKCVGNV